MFAALNELKPLVVLAFKNFEWLPLRMAHYGVEYRGNKFNPL